MYYALYTIIILAPTHGSTDVRGGKDKIIAKRHCIPSDLKAEWNTLNEQTACFESEALYRSAVKGQEMNKHIDYSGSVKELSQLVKQLKTLNKKVNVTRVHH